MDYLLIFIGASLGMLLVISAKSFYVQQSSKWELDFVKAFKVYTTKYTAPIVIGYIVILTAMFILPDLIANSGDTKFGLKVQHVLDYLRSYAFVLGVLSQGLGFLIVRKGEKFLKDEEQKIKSNDNQK